jgi:hypothetical protein
MRLITGTTWSMDDIEAYRRGVDLLKGSLERTAVLRLEPTDAECQRLGLPKGWKPTEDQIARERFGALAWMVAAGLLEVKIALPLDHAGHPLMLALTDMILEQNANLLRRGAVLVDPADDTEEPWLLFLLTHEIKSGDGAPLSKRMQFIRVNPDGSAAFAGWAPHLDLEPLADADRARLTDLLAAPWIRTDQEQKAISLAASSLVPEHFKEVAGRRVEHVDKTLEIDADFPNGASDTIKRGVGENATSLGFKVKDWEQ